MVPCSFLMTTIFEVAFVTEHLLVHLVYSVVIADVINKLESSIADGRADYLNEIF